MIVFVEHAEVQLGRLAGDGEAGLGPDGGGGDGVAEHEIDDGDALKARNFRVQSMSALRELDSRFPDGTQRRAQVASHLNT